MSLTIKQSNPTGRRSTGHGESQLATETTQSAGSSGDGSTGEAASQLVTKVVVPPEGSTPQAGPEASTE